MCKIIYVVMCENCRLTEFFAHEIDAKAYADWLDTEGHWGIHIERIEESEIGGYYCG